MAADSSCESEYLDIRGLFAVLASAQMPEYEYRNPAHTSVMCVSTRWGWPDSSFSVSVSVRTNCSHDPEDNRKWFHFMRPPKRAVQPRQTKVYRFFGCEYGHEVVSEVVYAIVSCATLTRATFVFRNFKTYPGFKECSDPSRNSPRRSCKSELVSTIRSKFPENFFAKNHVADEDAPQIVRNLLQQMNALQQPINLRVAVKPSHHVAMLKAMMEIPVLNTFDASLDTERQTTRNGLAFRLEIFRREHFQFKDDGGDALVDATMVPINLDFNDRVHSKHYSTYMRVSNLIASFKDVTPYVHFIGDTKELRVLYCDLQSAQGIAAFLGSRCGLHTLTLGGSYSELEGIARFLGSRCGLYTLSIGRLNIGSYSEEVVRLLLSPLTPDWKGQQSNTSVATLKFSVPRFEQVEIRRRRLKNVIRILEKNTTLRHVQVHIDNRRWRAEQSCIELEDVETFYEALGNNTALQSLAIEDWAFLRIDNVLQPTFCGEFPTAKPTICRNKKPVKEYIVEVKMD